MKIEQFEKATLYCGDSREILPKIAGGGKRCYNRSALWDRIHDQLAEGHGDAGDARQ